LYQMATAEIAAGDSAAARRALSYMLDRQQRPDGTMPQNTWLDGRPLWTGLQMDEVAFPLVLAWQLGAYDPATWAKLKRSADVLVARGPWSQQERWEEEAGYSPSTIAAEIAGLVCAADVARRNGDTSSSQRYLATADSWQRSVEGWTATSTGRYGDGHYYLRVDDDGDPDDGHPL